MFGRRKKQRATQIDTLIGQQTQVLGDISFDGALHVDGAVKGNIYANDNETAVLQVSDRGSVEGEVRVPYVILNGLVVGDVYAYQHIELAASARVKGNVYYGLIEMAMGAEVNGKLIHTSEEGRPTLALSHQEEPAVAAD
jgi:cytoskeletal protein CcmA (bactofilin family)